MGMQLVQHLIERILLQILEIDAKDIVKGGASDPSRHCMLGGGRDQSIKRHGASQLPHGLRQSELFQDGIKMKTLPELIADVHGPRFTMTLGGDASGVNAD